MKNKGSILIETICAIFMLSLLAVFSVSTCIENSKMIKERIFKEELNRGIYNIISELKYNTKMDELKISLQDKPLELALDEEFYDEILEKNILDLPKGKNIKISKIKEDDYEIEILIEGTLSKDNLNASVEESFIKTWWMEYV